MSEVAVLLELALQSHRDGELDVAADLYRRVLTQEPEQPDALALLGTLAAQTGDDEQAEALLLRALTREPDLPAALTNLADLYQRQGRVDAAADLMDRAVRLSPDDPAILGNAAYLFWQNGRMTEARRAADQALAVAPQMTQALNIRGLCALGEGDLQGARQALDAALTADPEYVEALVNKSRISVAEGNLEEALESLIRAAQLRPDSAPLWLLIADCLTQFGRYSDAHGVFAHARSLDPQDLDILRAWAGMLLRSGNPQAAEQCAQEGLLQAPADAGLLSLQGQARITMGDLSAGLARLRRAVSADPAFVPGRDLLAQHLAVSLGDGEAARAELLSLSRQEPGSALHSAWLRSLAADPEMDSERVAAAHREFAMLFPPRTVAEGNSLPAGEVFSSLRVGFVCADWGGAAARYVLTPLLARQAELNWTARVFDLSSTKQAGDDPGPEWRVAVGDLEEAALATRIAADRLDVLIDLTGHGAGGRPSLFRYRMAPAQGGWIGPGVDWENGLTELDFVLADDRVLRPEEAALLRGQRLPLPTALCFEGGLEAVAPSPLPAERTGMVTFGYQGDLALVGPETVTDWSALLLAVPGSRLAVAAPQLEYADSRARITTLFTAAGIAAERLILSGLADAEGRVRFYAGIDLAVTPYPADSGAETAEALWMGVPLVAVDGDRPAGRHAAALLRAAGFGDLVVADRAARLTRYQALAADLPALAQWRAGARQQMAGSVLCDGSRYGRTVIQALRMVTGQTADGASGHG